MSEEDLQLILLTTMYDKLIPRRAFVKAYSSRAYEKLQKKAQKERKWRNLIVKHPEYKETWINKEEFEKFLIDGNTFGFTAEKLEHLRRLKA